MRWPIYMRRRNELVCRCELPQALPATLDLDADDDRTHSSRGHVQYTVSIATGALVFFVHVGESYQDGDLEGFVGIANFLSGEDDAPNVIQRKRERHGQGLCIQTLRLTLTSALRHLYPLRVRRRAICNSVHDSTALVSQPFVGLRSATHYHSEQRKRLERRKRVRVVSIRAPQPRRTSCLAGVVHGTKRWIRILSRKMSKNVASKDGSLARGMEREENAKGRKGEELRAPGQMARQRP
ncbi:hypothetical protein B0H12DRAFT_380561 [Mycena haematopus]|nr:hypothetical protein B0H12DRAFT_380561 [Mycena haematopus]